MTLKLSRREKTLSFIAFLCVLFFFAWQLYLGPVYKGINSVKIEIANLQTQIASLKTAAVRSAIAEKIAPKDIIKIYAKDEQLNYVIRFIDYKFRWFGIQLETLSNSPGDDYIILDVKFKSTPQQFLGFLNSIPQAKTALIIDRAGLSLTENKLVSELRMLSYFSKEQGGKNEE
ncbi:MAG: hypothetical protein QME05_04160 [Candidatus Margulisbacteria bacterium]|nr:hypothetical protein [Candidatus Margulisiibacteriota bacterium]